VARGKKVRTAFGICGAQRDILLDDNNDASLHASIVTNDFLAFLTSSMLLCGAATEREAQSGFSAPNS
jgi:hypothetical protein